MEPLKDVPGVYEYRYQELHRKVREEEILQLLEDGSEEPNVDPT